MDRENNLYYYGARYFNPQVSRWMSADPAGTELLNPMSQKFSLLEGVNWYNYCRNNPVNYVDPTGCLSLLSAVNFDFGLDYWHESQRHLQNGNYWMWGVNQVDFYCEAIYDIAIGWAVLSWAGGLLGTAGTAGGAATATPVAADKLNLNTFSRAAEFGIQTYNKMRKVIKGTGLQAHHIIEQRFATALGLNTKQMLTVALTPEEHQMFTNAWREAVAYGSDYFSYTVNDVWSIAQRIYADYPALLEAARITLLGQ